jgi:hypothetical protein
MVTPGSTQRRAAAAAAIVEPVVRTSSTISIPWAAARRRRPGVATNLVSLRWTDDPSEADSVVRSKSLTAGRPKPHATERASSSPWSKPRDRARSRVVGAQVTTVPAICTAATATICSAIQPARAKRPVRFMASTTDSTPSAYAYRARQSSTPNGRASSGGGDHRLTHAQQGPSVDTLHTGHPRGATAPATPLTNTRANPSAYLGSVRNITPS